MIHLTLRCIQCAKHVEFSVAEDADERGGVNCPGCKKGELVIESYETDAGLAVRAAIQDMEGRLAEIEKYLVQTTKDDDIRFVLTETH